MVLGAGGGKMMEMFYILIVVILLPFVKTQKTVLSQQADFIVGPLYLHKVENKTKLKIKILTIFAPSTTASRVSLQPRDLSPLSGSLLRGQAMNSGCTTSLQGSQSTQQIQTPSFPVLLCFYLNCGQRILIFLCFKKWEIILQSNDRC